MRRRNLDYLVIAAMFVIGLYVTLSGLVMDVFGLHQFALHAAAGYVCAGLGVVHLALNWGRVRAYLRQRLGRREPRERPQVVPPEGAPLVGRRALLVSGLAAAGGFVLGRLIPDRKPVELPDEATDLGALYHQWSKPGGSGALGAMLDWGGRPAQYKAYPDAERVALPDPHGYQGLSLEETIEARRSVRSYAAEPLSPEELSRLLHAAQGITDRRGFRAAPSAGALYPIELYAAVHDVAGLEPGLYHYAVREHELELLQAGDFRATVTRAGLGQTFLGQAGVCLVLSAIFQRTRWRYRERTYRYVMLEAGHVAQNVYLAAASMGLGTCAVGAFFDDEFHELLGLDGAEEAVLYALSVGKV
jgi:SagB-type dehydrogenase family enzyme